MPEALPDDGGVPPSSVADQALGAGMSGEVVTVLGEGIESVPWLARF